jgi:hypothetical protein
VLGIDQTHITESRGQAPEALLGAGPDTCLFGVIG